MRLKRLLVQNFKVIERAEVAFGPGLNVLYGPNDIGKSTLLGAIRAVLLLQSNSSEAAGFKPWQGDHVPRVELDFEAPSKGLLRVAKEFAGGGRHSAKLEQWREGVGFEPSGAGRDVDGKLRELLGWGVHSPGGKHTVRGMPNAFLASALIGGQSGAEGLLAESFQGDTTESGRLRLTAALQAFAQDPRFKAILVAAQKKVDEFYSEKGTVRRGRHSPFYASSEKIKGLRARLDELLAQEAASTTAQAHFRALLERVDALSRAVDDARADLAATEALAQAQLSVDRAQAELGSIDARLAHAAENAARVKTLGVALQELEVAARAADARVQKAEADLTGAKEALRLATSAAAEQERSTTLAQLGEAQAKDDVERGQLEARATAARDAAKLAETLREGVSRRDRLLSERTQAHSRVEQHRSTEAQVLALRDRLSAVVAYGRWHDAHLLVEASVAGREAMRDLDAEIAEATAAASALRSEILALKLPELSVAQGLAELERELELARAKLGGGVSVSIRSKQPHEVRVVVDGKAEALAGAGGATRFEAQHTAAVQLGELLEVEVVAGDAERRAEFETLDAEWKRRSVVLAQAGASSAREFLAKCEGAQARLNTASEREKEALRLGEERTRHEAAAALLDSRVAAADALATAFEGHDRAELQGLHRSLPPGWQKSTSVEQKKLEAQLEQAKRSAAEAQLEVAAKSGELTQVEETIAVARSELEVAEKRLGQRADVLLAEVANQLKALDERRLRRGVERQQLEAAGATGANEARSAVTAAEVALTEALATRDLAGERRDAHRSVVDRAVGEQTLLQREVDALDRSGAAARAAEQRAVLANLREPQLPRTKAQLDELESQLRTALAERDKAEGALTQVGGSVVEDHRKEFESAHQRAEAEHRDLETDAQAWRLLKDALVQSEGAGARHVGKVLAEQVGRKLEALTQRPYRELKIDPNLTTTGLRVEGAERSVGELSVGTREQLATLLRLAIAESLGSAVVLDDHLVQTDPARLGWFVETLERAAEKIQVIVITCRQRDYAGAKAVEWIDLEKHIKRWPWSASRASTPPPAVLPVAAPPSSTDQALRVETSSGDEPWGSILEKALREMKLSPAEFAQRVNAGTRVVELWLKGTSRPAGQVRLKVIAVLKEAAASSASASSRAASRL